MAGIHVLSPHVANLIAAGEVVERPASAAKELVENAVDAGADAITVEIKSGGIAYLRVTDNGCGISREDVPKAFMRHSTSKIRNEEDLSHIGTLGFRGEALAAIASVSKIDLLTKRAEDKMGVSLNLEGGSTGKVEEAGCPDGTTIVVRNLFYNTPARMKFLKRDVTEGAAVEAVIISAALSHPEISFKFIREGKQVVNTPGDNDLKSCIYSLFGRDMSNGMLEAKSSFDAVTVSGFVSKPINSRGNRMMQYFFVNGRPIKSRLLSAALDEAYKNSLMKGRYPACVLFIDIPLEQVDVNVHPAKTEVKFAREREIFDAVFFAAKSGLNEDNGKCEAQFDKAEPELVKIPDPKPIEPKPLAPEAYEIPKINPNVKTFGGSERVNLTLRQTLADMPYHSPYKTVEKKAIIESPHSSEIIPRKTEYKDEISCDESQIVIAEMPEEKTEISADQTQHEKVLSEVESDYRVVGEVLNTYIIVEQEESVLLIDKHAAHERIIFNGLSKNESQPQSQMLITPVIVTATRQEIVALIEYKDKLENIGFEIDEFGDDSIAVRRVPDGISEGESEAVINEIAQALLDGKAPNSLEKLEAVCHSVACKAAIKAGKKSDYQELKKIADLVMSDPEIRYCPHGRPVTVEMTRYQLEKQFKRVT